SGPCPTRRRGLRRCKASCSSSPRGSTSSISASTNSSRIRRRAAAARSACCSSLWPISAMRSPRRARFRRSLPASRRWGAVGRAGRKACNRSMRRRRLASRASRFSPSVFPMMSHRPSCAPKRRSRARSKASARPCSQSSAASSSFDAPMARAAARRRGRGFEAAHGFGGGGGGALARRRTAAPGGGADRRAPQPASLGRSCRRHRRRLMRALPAIIVVAALIAGAVFIADRPGAVSLTWQGWRVDTSVAVLVLGVVIVAMLSALLFHLLRKIIGGPRAFLRARRESRRRRGYRALTQGKVAVAAGDAAEAKRYAKQADGLLAEPPLTLLLSAQAAQLNGDEKA